MTITNISILGTMKVVVIETPGNISYIPIMSKTKVITIKKPSIIGKTELRPLKPLERQVHVLDKAE
jgi:hypothetical protein